MAELAHTWSATLQEVKHQFDLFSASDQKEEGGWVDLDPAETAAALNPRGSALWPQHQWHAAYEILFALPPDPAAPQRDDMLFFVYLPWLQRSESLFVRRRSAQLPMDLCLGAALAANIDWRASVLLNLVMHTRYFLVVTVCSPDELAVKDFWEEVPLPAKRVRLESWPSTTRFPVDMEGNKAHGSEGPANTYPDICFEVSSFDTAFESQVLKRDSSCYTVALHANVADWRGGMVGSPPPPVSPPPGASSWPAAAADGSGRRQLVVAFCGFVTLDQLAEAGATGGALSLLAPRRAERVIMHGPGGEGRAEVAVSRVLPGLPALAQNGAGPLGRLKQAVRQVASEVKGQGGLEMRCALIHLTLPVQALARCILDAL